MQTIKPETHLYKTYDGQSQAQPVYVILDCDEKTLTADYDSDSNGVPERVWHGRVRRYQIPEALTTDALGRLLDDLAPLARAVLDSYNCDWDDSNYVGTVDSSADEALEDACRDVTVDIDECVWDASFWLQDTDLDITAQTTDGQIDQLARELEIEAAPSELAGTVDYLTTVRDNN